MSELIETLNSLKSDLSEIKSAVSKLKRTSVQAITDEWLDSQDVLLILHISKRSLQNLRDNGSLSFSRIRGKFYYKTVDVKELLERNYFKFGSGNQFNSSKTLEL